MDNPFDTFIKSQNVKPVNTLDTSNGNPFDNFIQKSGVSPSMSQSDSNSNDNSQDNSPSFWERVKKSAEAAGEGFSGKFLNAFSTLKDFAVSHNIYTEDTDLINTAQQIKDTTEAKKLANGQDLTPQETERLKTDLAASQIQPTQQDYINAGDPVREAGDQLLNSKAQNMAYAEQGASPTGKKAIQLGEGALEMVGDIAAGALTGTGALPMAVGALGNASYEARKSGANIDKQLAYGGLQAATVYATQGLMSAGGGVISKVLGQGPLNNFVTDATNKAIDKFVSGDVGKAVVDKIARTGEKALSQGTISALQAVLTPVYQRMTYDPTARADATEIINSALEGAAMGGLFGAFDLAKEGISNAKSKSNSVTPSEPAEASQSNFTAEPTNNTSKTEKLSTEPNNTVKATADSNTQPETTNELPNSVGAAAQGFDPYSALTNKYGAIPEGENPARVVDIPLKTSDNMNVSQGVRTAMEAKATPEANLGDIASAVTEGKFSYLPITDVASKAKAEQTIQDKGWDTAVKDWTAEARGGKVSKDLMVQGQVLYNNALNAGKPQEAVDILVDYVKMSRSGAQATQANRVLKQLDPQYQLYALQKSVQSMNEELTAKFAKSGFEGIKLDPELVQKYADAKTETERDTAMDNLKQSVADQMPSSWYDKWNAWRYLSMLGNPRTHIRNIMGNAGFAPVRIVKDVIATGIERATGVQNRTKAILTLKDTALIKHSLSDYANVEDQIMSQGKFDNLTGDINSRRTIFDLKPVEAFRKGNGYVLDKEDVFFARLTYADALSKWYKANKITADDLSGGKVPQEKIDTARAYAIKEAQKATYRDANDFSDFVARLGNGYKGNNKFAKAANVALEGVLPFKRTPANILARGVEYSPVGLIKGLTYDLAQVHKGNIEAWQAIDNISAGLTGTAIMGLGMWLAKDGIVTGGKSDDDKTAALDNLTGYQDYALNVGNKSYTLDWLAPESLPFFTGVELYKTMTQKGDTEFKLNTALDNLSHLTAPMINMSMLQGVDDVINGVKYSKGDSAPAVAATAAANYLSQGLPTLGGQIERVLEPNRQTTFIDKNSGVPSQIQRLIAKSANKIPGVDYNQMDYRDAFGRTQSNGSVGERIINNLFNPAYVSDIKDDKVTDELKRLNNGDYLNTTLDSPDSTVTYNGNKYNLTKDEYEKYSKRVGQNTYDLMQSMIDDKAYSKMTNAEKAEQMSKIYGYAQDQARKQYIESQGKTYEEPDTYKGIYKAQQQGVSNTAYLTYKVMLNRINTDGGSATQVEEAKAIQQTSMTNAQRGKLYSVVNPETKPAMNPFTGDLAKAGMSAENVINLMDKKKEIEDNLKDYQKQGKGLTKTALEMSYLRQWLSQQKDNGKPYTSGQINYIMDRYLFFQQIPGKETRASSSYAASNPMR